MGFRYDEKDRLCVLPYEPQEITQPPGVAGGHFKRAINLMGVPALVRAMGRS